MPLFHTNALTAVMRKLAQMDANLFSRLERFREESQVMAAHWLITQIDNNDLTQSLSHLDM